MSKLLSEVLASNRVYAASFGERSRRWRGPQVSHSAVVDDAPGMGLRAGEKIRSAWAKGILSAMACFLDAASQPEAHQGAVPERR